MSENPANPANPGNPANQGGQTPPPGWWQAWDGKWYPATVRPEAIPGPASQAQQTQPLAQPLPQPLSGAPYAQPFAQPFAPPSPYGPPGYPMAPMGAGPYGAPLPVSSGTNGMSIAALVLGILWLYGVGSILSLIFGYISLGQIKRDPSQKGKGMAIAGVVLGWVGIVGLIIVIAIIGFAATSGFDSYDDYSY
ncbi:unannotated protein [freshwater metagenome]|uniref:Unannotated protein n=1 Tax=freshwater metagenome TaxID=449393 RepID=A0A6J6QTQ7_9ZZZZ|nr:DUF4190 domain-containing protein [Actinomycetota bacterium]